MNSCKQCEHFIILERGGRVHQFCVAKEPQETPKVNCAFFESAQHKMHLTAFGAQLAMVLVIIGVR